MPWAWDLWAGLPVVRLGQLRLGLRKKNGSGAQIQGALGAIEKVRLEVFAVIRRHLIQQVLLDGHLLYSFAMIHELNPH